MEKKEPPTAILTERTLSAVINRGNTSAFPALLGIDVENLCRPKQKK